MMNESNDDFSNGNKPVNWKVRPSIPKPPLFMFVGLGTVLFLILAALGAGWFAYTSCRIEVPAKHIAILIKKTGLDITNDQELAPDKNHKGVQKDVVSEGRHFYNPYHWEWKVIAMEEVPTSKLGVLVRLQGDDLGYAQIMAWEDTQKGIVPEVLRPGRYPINPYLEKIELHDPVTVPAGYKGVVTLLSAPLPENPNLPVSAEPGKRGVQPTTLDPGTYYLNPYVTHVSLVDCRSQRFDLASLDDMGFPSKDGFWVSLDGIIEFRVKPDHAAQVFVIYNEVDNDQGGEKIDEEIREKIIMPNARSFCRLLGSNSSGRDFIGGKTRSEFQHKFQEAMRQACDPLGVEIIQALITDIKPPQRIAGPVRDREVARQKLNQFKQQILQQQSEMKLAVENELVSRSSLLVKADQEVVTLTVKAMREQEVAITKANETLGVARFKLEASKDEAAAIVARGTADASVIVFQNEAQAAGWRESVLAFGGDGNAYARYILYRALAPGYNNIMVNTADSPMMDVFKSLQDQSPAKAQ